MHASLEPSGNASRGDSKNKDPMLESPHFSLKIDKKTHLEKCQQTSTIEDHQLKNIQK